MTDYIWITSKEGTRLLLVGRILKQIEPDKCNQTWTTDVTKLVDGEYAKLKELFKEFEGQGSYPTSFAEHRIGCCTFGDYDWDLIMEARKEYKKRTKKGTKKRIKRAKK